MNNSLPNQIITYCRINLFIMLKICLINRDIEYINMFAQNAELFYKIACRICLTR